jgi:hypothetical protein
MHLELLRQLAADRVEELAAVRANGYAIGRRRERLTACSARR